MTCQNYSDLEQKIEKKLAAEAKRKKKKKKVSGKSVFALKKMIAKRDKP